MGFLSVGFSLVGFCQCSGVVVLCNVMDVVTACVLVSSMVRFNVGYVPYM